MDVFRSNTIDAAFRQVADQQPEKTAILFKGEKTTFSELDIMVEKIAEYLFSKGLKRQERAIIYLPHMPQWVAIWLAMQRIGAVAIPVTHFYGHEELAYIAKDSETGTVFCTDANLEEVIKAAADNPFKRIIVVGENYTQDSVQNIDKNTTEIIPFTGMINEKTPSLPPIQIEEKEIAEILYTGGTTGFPKGVPLSNILLLTAMDVKRSEYLSLTPPGEGVAIQGAPLNHILGQEVGLGALLSGDTLILLAKMDLDDLFAHIEKYKVTTFYGTPTLCRMILEHENLGNYDFSSLGYVFTAGEAMPKEVARKWVDFFKKPTYNGYGSTETCGGITGIPVGVPCPEGTAGKVVYTKKIMLINSDTLEPVAANEPGELLVSSENMVTGYWNKPEETALYFVTLDDRLWYKTGDIVRIDEEGWVFFVDRSVDMIKHKGYRVAATKVEAVLYKHKAVVECCVVGVPDSKFGEIIKAFVVLKKGMENVTEEELINWCREGLSSYEVPVLIEFRDTLPKSAVGKILRRKVRDEERAKQNTA
ncbi:MAG: class I adenylate-forming enzyme family protein [Bacillota bacterium]|nr:class I adenylate-forming enzyme family protein [Bacillota bacterium]